MGGRRCHETLALAAHTPNTITDPGVLLSALDHIRAHGYALDEEEFIEGMVAISVPVTDPAGRFVAALAFHGPVQRMNLTHAIAQLPVLEDGAARLRRLFFGE